MEDRTIVAAIVEWADRSGDMPGRNRVMAEYKIGATRATRLLAEADQEVAARSGPRRRRPAQPPGPNPDRAAQETGPGGGGPQEPNRSTDDDLPIDPDQEPADLPDREPAPDGLDQASGSGRTAADRSDLASDHADVDHVGPDQEPGPDQTGDRTEPTRTVDPDQTDPAADHRPGPMPERTGPDRRTVWPVLLLALPAFVAIWSGWVGLGELTGFGPVHPLPGIWDDATINSAITLPIGVETYAAYALRVWLSGVGPQRARTFAKVSSIGSLLLGAAGQIAYHLMEAAGLSAAPWQITTLVACIPVAVLGMGAALAHLSGHER